MPGQLTARTVILRKLVSKKKTKKKTNKQTNIKIHLAGKLLKIYKMGMESGTKGYFCTGGLQGGKTTG